MRRMKSWALGFNVVFWVRKGVRRVHSRSEFVLKSHHLMACQCAISLTAAFLEKSRTLDKEQDVFLGFSGRCTRYQVSTYGMKWGTLRSWQELVLRQWEHPVLYTWEITSLASFEFFDECLKAFPLPGTWQVSCTLQHALHPWWKWWISTTQLPTVLSLKKKKFCVLVYLLLKSGFPEKK